MKRKLYLITLTVVLFTLQIAFAQDDNTKSFTHKLHGLNGPTPGGGILPNSVGFSNTGGNIDVVYHRCDWTINPTAAKNIAGTVTTYFKTTAANVNVLTLDFNKASFDNGSLVVRYHGTVCPVSFPASGAVNIITINLPAPAPIVAIGTLDSVSITYSGAPPAVSGLAQGYQKVSTAANQYITTLSESYEDRDWWPCKADMQDKIDSMDINITVPWNPGNANVDTFWAAANGLLVDSAIAGLNRTFKFKTRYPIASYLVAISVGKFSRYYTSVNVSGTNTQVAYYILRNTTTHATKVTAMNKINPVLQAFSVKYGDYPFKLEKHGFYDGLLGAAGMEHQTFSGIANGSLTNLGVLTHELAHQWFGDKVSFATWNHLWLAEGFAKYSEALGAELVPANGLDPVAILTGIKSTARGLTGTPVILSAASIANSNTIWTTNNDNAVYQRGAMNVSMLRAMMGDVKFFQGLRDYLNDPLLAYKSATTADLQRNLENQMSGVNLTPFFNSWASPTGTGTPNYTGNYYINGNTIQFNLTQTRTPGATPFMPMPVAIRIRNAALTLDTNIVIYHYSPTQLGYAGDQYGMGPAGNAFITYNLSFAPSVITIDPFSKTMASGTLTPVGSPLDVSILNFNASKSATGNIINLSLSNNEPVEKVILLKSFDGTGFTEAGTMTNVNSNGQENNFGFTDIVPNSKTIYYRAKIFTANKQSYTAIVKVQGSVYKEVIVSPNPASDVINISFNNLNNEKTSVRVINAEGKTVIESVTNNNFIHFDVTTLSSGIYITQVIKQGKVESTTKFLIRH